MLGTVCKLRIPLRGWLQTLGKGQCVLQTPGGKNQEVREWGHLVPRILKDSKRRGECLRGLVRSRLRARPRSHYRGKCVRRGPRRAAESLGGKLRPDLASPCRREALPLQLGRLRLEVCALRRTHAPLPQAHGSPAVPVPPVRPCLLTLRPPGATHEAAHVAWTTPAHSRMAVAGPTRRTRPLLKL